MKYLLTLLWLLGAIAAQAQEYTGHVADKEDGAPVAGAIVTARDSLGKPLGYTTTSASGDFVLRPRGGGTTAQLDFSTMGYRRQSIPADAGRMLVLLTPEATGIREVTIRAPRLSFRGDTVSYNVSRFTEAQDRSIADVLRKMPGIEVAKSGEIRYNGQPINNFYIEGLDMLDGRYGQATNNIAPQDVASVEVMENHQPIKALKDIVFSDRAAINLRLKPHAKARWTGTLRGGAGWSPALWNGALFAMRIGARGQSMVNLKTDNTGQNPSAETERLSVEDILNGGANDYNPAAHLSVGTSSAPLDDTRTRFNRSHMASLNNLRKLSEDYQLSSSLTWGYDRLASDRAARQSWYLADGTRVDTEQESAASCRQQLSARIALKANTERFYMLEKLEASLAWNDLRAVLSGSYPNRQRAEAPAYGIENDLKYIRRTGTRSLTVTSYLKYLTRPQSLDVVRETGSQRQTIADRAFYMNHNAAFGTQAGQFAFAFKGGVSALFRGLVTDLTGTGLGTGAANDLSAGYAGVYLQPGITYRSQRLRPARPPPGGGPGCVRPAGRLPPLWTARQDRRQSKPGGHFHLEAPLRGEMEPHGTPFAFGIGYGRPRRGGRQPHRQRRRPAQLPFGALRRKRIPAGAAPQPLGRHRLQEPDRRVLRQPARGTFVERPAVPACAALRRRLYRKLLRAQLEPRAVMVPVGRRQPEYRRPQRSGRPERRLQPQRHGTAAGRGAGLL